MQKFHRLVDARGVDQMIIVQYLHDLPTRRYKWR